MPTAVPTIGPSADWTPFAFLAAPTVQTPCQGERYVKYLPTYGKWVGISLCSSVRYKIFLGDDPRGMFYEIGDYAGHGQDHCELVNPTFRIPDEDDMTSGGCTTCSIDGAHVFQPPVGSQGWSRGRFGEPFEFESSWPPHNLYTAQWYECGVTVPSCAATTCPANTPTEMQTRTPACSETIASSRTPPPTVQPPAGWGDRIDTADIRGPVGIVLPAVDSATAPSFDDIATFCRAHPDYDAPPPLLALPPPSELPEWCSEAEAYRQLVEGCGAPRVVVVAMAADPAVADGSVEKPFATISDAIRACGRDACHIVVGAGVYAESLQVAACTFIEGGIRIENGIVTKGAARPRIERAAHASGNAIVLARIDVQDTYGALGTHGDVPGE